jgi:hypothetical protein
MFLVENIKDVLTLLPEYRMGWIRKEVEKRLKDETVICTNCSNKVVPIKITQKEPCIRFSMKLQLSNILEQYNPIYVYFIL